MMKRRSLLASLLAFPAAAFASSRMGRGDGGEVLTAPPSGRLLAGPTPSTCECGKISVSLKGGHWSVSDEDGFHSAESCYPHTVGYMVAEFDQGAGQTTWTITGPDGAIIDSGGLIEQSP